MGQTFGTDEQGFEVGVADSAQTIHVKMWGFWTPETASRFSETVLGACATGGVSFVAIDATDLKPMRDIAQEAFGSVLAGLPAYKVRRVLVATASPLTRLQLLRIAKERAENEFVRFVT
jgi:hypothetical protein